MSTKIKILCTFLFLLAGQLFYSQVTGTVMDVDGYPLFDAEVVVKGKDIKSYTDSDGKFTIEAKVGDELEVFSFDGSSTSFPVTSTSMGVLKMKETLLKEVVAYGYGITSTKANTKGAQTTLDSETFEGRPNVSFLSSMQGTTPGLNIASSSGQPGSAKIDYVVRGLGSLSGDTQPLIVIDGIVSNQTQYRNLNANDIESSTILRDSDATSLYGNRGANGVIVITTRRAKFNQPINFSFDMSTSISSLPENKYNISNSKEVLTIQKNYGQGFGSTLTEQEIEDYDINTNWKDVFFKSGETHTYNFGVNYGGENLRNFTSIGYMEQEGFVPTTDFQRFTLRSNLDGKSENNKFNYFANIALAYSKRNELNQETNSGINANVIQNPLHGAILGLPYLQSGQFATGMDLYDAIGTSFTRGNSNYVLEDVLKQGNYPSYVNEVSTFTTIGATYKFNDNWSANSKIGIDYNVSDRLFARAPWSYLAIAVRESDSRNPEFGGFESQTNIRDISMNSISSINFDKKFNDVHHLTAGAYIEYVKLYRRTKFQRQNGLNPLTYSPGAGTGYVSSVPGAGEDLYVPSVSSSKSDAGSFSYFGRVDYDYSSKYGFGATLRRDASYKFVNDNKWGTFWSVSGRWNIDKEDFMSDSKFSMLKLRASYGTQGNQNILTPIPGLNPLYLGGQLTRDQYASANLYNNQNGTALAQIANPDLRWEEQSTFDVGLDFRVFNNKLEGSFDYYDRVTKSLYSSVAISAIIGNGTSVSANNGKLKNSGFEAVLRYNAIKKEDFSLSFFGNGSYNKNRVLEIYGDERRTGDLIFQPGGPAYEWNLIPYVGVNPANGNLLFLDKDGNLTENPTDDDRRSSGKSYFPVYQGGFGLNADYKGFFLDLNFAFVSESYKWDNQLSWLYDPTAVVDYNVSADLLNAWTPNNVTDFPALNATNYAQEGSSDRYLYNSSYVRLKTAMLGYNLPSAFLSNIGVNKITMYLQAENLLTFTKWRGWDPEGFNTFPLGSYPNSRVFTAGFNINF